MKNQMEIRMLHLQEHLEKDIQLLKSTNWMITYGELHLFAKF